MGKSGKFWLLGGVIVVILGVSFGVYEYTKPLTNEQFKALPIVQQFKKAPKGHYIHLRKKDPILFRTTWSKKITMKL